MRLKCIFHRKIIVVACYNLRIIGLQSTDQPAFRGATIARGPEPSYNSRYLTIGVREANETGGGVPGLQHGARDTQSAAHRLAGAAAAAGSGGSAMRTEAGTVWTAPVQILDGHI